MCYRSRPRPSPLRPARRLGCPQRPPGHSGVALRCPQRRRPAATALLCQILSQAHCGVLCVSCCLWSFFLAGCRVTYEAGKHAVKRRAGVQSGFREVQGACKEPKSRPSLTSLHAAAAAANISRGSSHALLNLCVTHTDLHAQQHRHRHTRVRHSPEQSRQGTHCSKNSTVPGDASYVTNPAVHCSAEHSPAWV